MQPALANTQQEARTTWSSAFMFELIRNGLGARLACTDASGSSSRAALVYPLTQPEPNPNTAVISNTGVVVAYIALGDSSVVATTSCYPILPGTKETISIPEGGSWTHAAGITDSGAGATTLFVHLGFGN